MRRQLYELMLGIYEAWLPSLLWDLIFPYEKLFLVIFVAFQMCLIATTVCIYVYTLKGPQRHSVIVWL